MTVIAFDGKYLAADSAGFRGELRLPWAMEKIRLDHELGLAFAHSGIDGQFDEMVQWYLHEGANSKTAVPMIRDSSSCLIVIERNSSTSKYYVTGGGGVNLSHGPWAWAAGSELALGALRRGANAIQAVKVACDLSMWCGEPVQAADMSALQMLKWPEIEDLLA